MSIRMQNISCITQLFHEALQRHCILVILSTLDIKYHAQTHKRKGGV